jgi:hypothetical protein
LNVTHLVSTLRKRWQQSFFVLLALTMLTAWVALPQTAFASQEQEKAEINPSSVAKNNGQRTTDDGQRTNDQTAFTYQGQLKDSSGPVNGSFDFQFILYSAQTKGEKLGSIDIENLALTNGLFNVRLDFGRTVFEAKEGWLEIGVRPGGSTEPYTVLFPRQKLTPTPYAIFAQHEQWSLIGVLVGFAADKDKNADVISMDEKKISMADMEASLAKLTDKAVTSTKLDEGSVTLPEISPNAAPNGSCNLPLPCSNSMPSNETLLSLSNTGSGHGFYASSMGSGLQSGIVGDNLNSSAGGYGVSGYSFGFAGVFGFGKSATSNGVFGHVNNREGSGIFGRNDGDNPLASWGVFGFSPKGFAGVFGAGGQNGVFGVTGNRTASGVYGKNDSSGWGVFGESIAGGVGVQGKSNGNDGVVGESNSRNGVYGRTSNGTATGVFGENFGGGSGVYGKTSGANAAVFGENFGNGPGVTGKSATGDGVFGETNSATRVGGFFKNNAGGLALRVDGTASTKVLQITGGMDIAEPFEMTDVELIQPGMVVSIDPKNPGKLVVSSQAYDHRAAGIISGAGGINPGLTMKQEGAVADGAHPVALTGRVYCWADASYGAIEPGDLLTTSDTPGHAMKVTDHAKAQGAIIGKAMTGLKQGETGLVLVLVTLQ